MRWTWVAMVGVGCGQEDPPASLADGVLALEADAARGEAVYAAECAFCHGVDGTGGTGPSFVAAFEQLHEAGDSWEEEARMWVTTIWDGEGVMPAWGEDLSEQDVADVVHYMHVTWGM